MKYFTTVAKTGLARKMGSIDILVVHYVFLSLLLLTAAQAIEEHFEHEDEIYGMFQNGFPNDGMGLEMKVTF